MDLTKERDKRYCRNVESHTDRVGCYGMFCISRPSRNWWSGGDYCPLYSDHGDESTIIEGDSYSDENTWENPCQEDTIVHPCSRGNLSVAAKMEEDPCQDSTWNTATTENPWIEMLKGGMNTSVDTGNLVEGEEENLVINEKAVENLCDEKTVGNSSEGGNISGHMNENLGDETVQNRRTSSVAEHAENLLLTENPWENLFEENTAEDHDETDITVNISLTENPTENLCTGYGSLVNTSGGANLTD